MSSMLDPLNRGDNKDVEQNGLASIEESAGWHYRVKSKLASWDPEDEDQWEVSVTYL